MDPLASLRRALVGLAGACIALAVMIATARSNEVPASAHVSGFVIHDAAETLRDFCSTDGDGVMWFELPGGSRWELVTSTSDPAITNPGDGAFHTFDGAEVRAALDAVSYPLERVSADIFVLPYPRRAGLESAAGPGLILLAPGVQPLTAAHQHAEFIHELGHVVQYALMPDADTGGWTQYRRLRGIIDPTLYSATAVHADRPHEIFAEDFRASFGDALANYSGSIENAAIEPPADILGLTSFMTALAGPAVQLVASPNPSAGATRFSRSGVTTAPLELFDLSGRRVATVPASAIPGGTNWSWDGRESSGRRTDRGVLFARVRGERAATRIVVAP